MLNYSKGTSLGEKKAYNSFIPQNKVQRPQRRHCENFLLGCMWIICRFWTVPAVHWERVQCNNVNYRFSRQWNCHFIPLLHLSDISKMPWLLFLSVEAETIAAALRLQKCCLCLIHCKWLVSSIKFSRLNFHDQHAGRRETFLHRQGVGKSGLYLCGVCKYRLVQLRNT